MRLHTLVNTSDSLSRVARPEAPADPAESSRDSIEPHATVSVDPDVCSGMGECVRIAPGAFRIDDDLNVAVPLPGAIRTELGLLLEAAANCPTRAISVVVPRRAGAAAGEERPA